MKNPIRRLIVTYFPDAFLRFLIKEKALDAYLSNIENASHYFLDSTINRIEFLKTKETRKQYLEYYSKSSNIAILIDAFDWFRSPEGEEYWYNLYAKLNAAKT